MKRLRYSIALVYINLRINKRIQTDMSVVIYDMATLVLYVNRLIPLFYEHDDTAGGDEHCSYDYFGADWLLEQ